MSQKRKHNFLVKLVLAFGLVLSLLSFPLHAQRFKGAVMGGMNLTQVDGDEVYGYRRVGGHLGVAAILPIKKFDITLETVFNQKGAYQKTKYPGDSLNGARGPGAAGRAASPGRDSARRPASRR